MRLAGISDMESANRFLEEKYLRAFHRQFGREAASPVDVHRGVPRNLNEVLSWEEQRVVQNDWTVACAGRRYQLDRQHQSLSLVRRKVIVRTLRSGRVQLAYGGKPLQWRSLPVGAERKTRPKQAKQPKRVKTKMEKAPPANHPWRREGAGAGRKSWHGIKAEGKRPRTAARLGLRDSGRPPLRSGLPASRNPKQGKRTGNNQ